MLRVINILFFAFFIAAAALNVNDPDAELWIAIYGLAALWSGLFLWKRRVPLAPVAVFSALCLVGASWLASQSRFGEPLFAQEIFREALGLIIASAWTFLLFNHTKRVKRFMFAGPY